MLTLRHIGDIQIFGKWALCARQVGDEIWVGSMAGQIAALDMGLQERRRWQAHDGSVNGILSDGTTYGGDGCVKDRAGTVLAGPFKKPVSKVQRHGDGLYIGTYERALYRNSKKQPKIAAWHVLGSGDLCLVRQIGTRAGDLGPIELKGQEVAPPAWTLSAGPASSGSTPDTFFAYFTDGRFGEVTQQGQITFLPWQDTQGPPCVVHGESLQGQVQPEAQRKAQGEFQDEAQSDVHGQDQSKTQKKPQSQTLCFFIGNHKVLAIRDREIAGELTLKTKGLYGSTLLPDGRLLIAAADGNLKVIEIAA